MRVLVCGGRNFGSYGLPQDARAQRAFLIEKLEALHQQLGFSLVITGGASGIDSLAHDWARARSIATRIFGAEWDHMGRVAGPIRNAQMLAEGQPDFVVAFPGNAGTRNMVNQAKAAKKPVIWFYGISMPPRLYDIESAPKLFTWSYEAGYVSSDQAHGFLR